MRRTPQKRSQIGASFVAYYRVSDPKQGRSGLGLEAQTASAARYLASVNGVLIAEYTEVETGKRHGRRPQLAAAIAEAKRRHAILLIAKLDRLARNVAFVSNLMESATDFVIADMPSANRLTIHLLAAVAEYEGEMISERTKAALAAAKARGTKLGNPNWRAALVLAWAARKPAATPSEIAGIVATYRAEGLSLRQIAARLNAAGMKTPSGAMWHPSSVHRVTAELT